ncbi:MAG: DUF4102 domain-containing protein [Chitinophagia bacterium]|nr:DUF4102 domain-containing protein [Chitinophagia bacterium]
MNPMQGFKLNTTAIRNAKAKAKPYRLSAGRGLVLLVHPNGSKYWQYRYRRRGKEHLISIGVWGTTRDFVSLDEAFAAREEIRAKIKHGIDPAEEKRAQKRVAAEREGKATTFEKVALQWLSVWGRGKSERTFKYQERRLQTDIFPLIGSMPIEMVGRKDVIEVVKHIDSRGAHEMASPKELPELLKKISGYQGLLTRYAMELMALTFVRTSELIQAKWSEFDFDNKRWVIPAERMKKAKGMQAAHIVPLATQTLMLLQQLKTISGASTFLFPGLDARKPISNNTILMALKNLGYKGRMTGHGFRSVASTVLHEQGFNHLYIERQLSHMERDEVAAAYNYAEYLEQRTAMMQWWADYLEEARK